MFPNLGAFVSALENADELARISVPVSSILEITEIADRVSKSPCPHLPSHSARMNDPRFHGKGGRALLFENVEGSNMPLLINAWGSYRRMEMALGCNEAGPGAAAGHTPGGFDAIGKVIGDLVKPQPPRSFGELVAKAKQFLPLLRIPPKRVTGRGACQEVVLKGDEIDLTRLPIIRCWPQDGDFAALGYPAEVNDGIAGLGRGAQWDAQSRGKYITLAGIHTVHADDEFADKPASHNIGMYRVQLLGKNRVAMHWHMHHDGARHWRSWKKLGKKMPVAIALGGQSIMPYAATAPLPPGISELLLAGFLNKKGIKLCKGVSVPVWLPADCELVLEGYVSSEAGLIDYDPRSGEPIGPGGVFEGPFGDHTGFYSLPDRYPIVEITAVTMRRSAIYPTTVVGLPPQEDYYLGKATERIFFPLLKTIIHDIEDYDLPMFGAFHNCAALQIDKSYPMQGRRVMHSVWGAGQMAWTKTILVVPKAVDVHDTPAVLAQLARFCHPIRDVETVVGPLDILDHAAPHLGAGTKIGFDGTVKREGESVHGVPTSHAATARPPASHAMVDIAKSIAGVTDAALPESCGGGWLFIRCDKQQGGGGRGILEQFVRLCTERSDPTPSFVVLVSGNVDVQNIDDAMFHWCAHTDAGRDALRYRSADHSRCMLLFDATIKMPGDQRLGWPVRSWPPILQMDAGTKQKVTARWSQYGV